MVAHRTLTPFVRVRILHPLPSENPVVSTTAGFLFCIFAHRHSLIFTCVPPYLWWNKRWNKSIAISDFCLSFFGFVVDIVGACLINQKVMQRSSLLLGISTVTVCAGVDFGVSAASVAGVVVDSLIVFPFSVLSSSAIHFSACRLSEFNDPSVIFSMR